MSAVEKLSAVIPALVKTLEARGIERRYLQFGGADATATKPFVPTDARSEFLANRAMGDWAENTLADAIEQTKKYSVKHYGNAERLAAGDPGFKDFYLSAYNEVCEKGKRPDLLLFAYGKAPKEDLAVLPRDQTDPFVKDAVGAIEVRSSKVEADVYMKVRKDEAQKGTRETPSFTVKVEDLRVVYRWIERHNIPQAYCQVFFDSAYAISVQSIFETIAAAPKDVTFDKPAKSQLKSTIMIPITYGARIGSFVTKPEYGVAKRVTRLGRHDAYVVPSGGDLRLDAAGLLTLFS